MIKRIDKDVLVKRINRSHAFKSTGQRIRSVHGRAGFAGNVVHIYDSNNKIVDCIGTCKGLEEYARTLGVLADDEHMVNERGRHDL